MRVRDRVREARPRRTDHGHVFRLCGCVLVEPVGDGVHRASPTPVTDIVDLRVMLLRDHPHLQGLLLGTVLLAAAVASAPYAIDAVAHMADPPGVDGDPRGVPDGDSAAASDGAR
jgi:hypothetical protein